MSKTTSSTQSLRIGVEGAIVAALAMVLSFIPMQIGSSFSVSLGMIPMTLYALRRGFKAGFFAAFLWGLLHFFGNIYILSVTQVIIEYVVAFGFAGFAGFYAEPLHKVLLKNEKKKGYKYIWEASFIGTFARFFWHFVAGVVFWGSYALWGMSPIIFSLVMNGASALATSIVTGIILSILFAKWPKLFMVETR